MIDAQIMNTSKFTAQKTGITYYSCEILIPALGVMLPLMGDSPFINGTKGKAVFGLSQDRKALRITEFIKAVP